MAEKKSSAQTEPVPAFEEALTRLQDIVADLESGELGLETSLQRYEEGVGLIRLCYKTLEAAEQKIELLTRIDESGNPHTEEFDAESTFSQTGGEAKRRRSASKKASKKSKSDQDDSDDSEEDPRKLLF
ncbi:MAG: exodeoxyribonuclease VII small subunit [Planctomycetaceae bacterium]